MESGEPSNKSNIAMMLIVIFIVVTISVFLFLTLRYNSEVPLTHYNLYLNSINNSADYLGNKTIINFYPVDKAINPTEFYSPITKKMEHLPIVLSSYKPTDYAIVFYQNHNVTFIINKQNENISEPFVTVISYAHP